MRELRGIDLKRACLVPSSVFSSPEEVADAEGLSLAQKLTILRRWEFDARRIGSFAGDPSMLAQVERALAGLSAGAGRSARPTRPDAQNFTEVGRAPLPHELRSGKGTGLGAAHGLAKVRS